MDPVVSTEWLAERLGEPNLKIVDAPFYMPGDPRTPEGEFAKAHVPGAIFFDIDKICDRASALPHMLASPEAFAEAVGRLGVGNGDEVVVYDHLGLMSAARVWWNFRTMGHDRVHVLDGGLPRWVAEGRPVASGSPEPARSAVFIPRVRAELVRDIGAVRAALARGDQVLDARAADRFAGTAPEPRPGLPSGHMPGALNLPHADIVRDGALLAKDRLAERFDAAGADLARPVVATCGSGVSAAVLALALARLGRWDASVYDGSWTEWAGRSDTAIEPGRPG